MSDENRELLVTIEKQSSLVGVPFTPVQDKPMVGYKTNWDYWTAKKEFLIGRVKDKKFEVYNNATKQWEERNWKDFEYTNAEGQTRNYFKKQYKWIVDFENEVEFEDLYNPNTKVKGTQKLKRAVITLTKMPNDEMEKVVRDHTAMGILKKNLYKFNKTGSPPQVKYDLQFAGNRQTPLESSSSSSSTTQTTINPTPAITPVPKKEVDKSYLKEIILGQDGGEFLVEDIIKDFTADGMGAEYARETFKQNFLIEDDLLDEIIENEFE